MTSTRDATASGREVVVRRLRADDDRSTFASGNEQLDRFFHRYAGQNQFVHHIGTTFVAVDAGTGELLGYVTLAAATINRKALPSTVRQSLPSYPLPALRLARLAVDGRARGQGVSKVLLRAVFVAAHQQARLSGCVGIVVDAKSDVVDLYAKYGFEPLEVESGELQTHPEQTPMFLELGAIPADDDE